MSRFRIRGRKKQKKEQSLRHAVPLRMMVPNMLTFLAAAFGISAIRYACLGRWKASVVSILIAAMFDGVDGRVARLLSATSKLGAELDSLSDFVSFGVAPAILMYLWFIPVVTQGTVFYPVRGLFWGIALFYALCCGFRLARFNIMIEEGPTQPYWKHFFMGLPAPGGAGLVILPVICSFIFGDVCRSPLLGAASLLTCGVLMASRFPTISAKKIRVPRSWMMPVLLLVLFTIGMLISQFWLTLSCIGVVYYLTIPLGGYCFHRLKKRAQPRL